MQPLVSDKYRTHSSITFYEIRNCEQTLNRSIYHISDLYISDGKI